MYDFGPRSELNLGMHPHVETPTIQIEKEDIQSGGADLTNTPRIVNLERIQWLYFAQFYIRGVIEYNHGWIIEG